MINRDNCIGLCAALVISLIMWGLFYLAVRVWR